MVCPGRLAARVQGADRGDGEARGPPDVFGGEGLRTVPAPGTRELRGAETGLGGLV